MKNARLLQYAVLACILAAGIGTYYYVRQSPILQMVVGVIISVSYMIWGIIYHTLQKDLHRKVVIEYILIGSIAIVLLATVLLR